MVDLLNSVKAISKRRFYSNLLQATCEGLFLSSLVVVLTYTFWKYDYPILALLFVFILYFLIKVIPLLKSLLDDSADIESCKTLDEHLGLKDRILSWYFLQKQQTDGDQRSIIMEIQAEPAVSECNLNRVIATNFSSYDVAKLIIAFIALGFLFFFPRPANHNSAIVSKIEEAIHDPQVPPEIKEELLKVTEAIDNRVSTERIQSLAEQALSTIEAFDSNIVSTTAGETIPASSAWSSSPTPTPTPTATPTRKGEQEKSKNDQRVDNQNTASSKNDKSPKEKLEKSNSQKKSDQCQDPKVSQSNSSENPQDGSPSDSKNNLSKESGKKGDKGKEADDEKGGDGKKPENNQPDENKDSSKGPNDKEKGKNAEKGVGQKDQKSGQKQENTSGQNSKEDAKQDKKPGDTPSGQEPDQKNNEQNQPKDGKEGKPEKDGEPSKKQEPGGAKSDSIMSLSRAKEALNQLKTKNPEKSTPAGTKDMNENGESSMKAVANENSKKEDKAQNEKGPAVGRKDSELAFENKEKKGKGDKPDLPSSTKYKDEIITIEQGKIDRNQVGKSAGTKELPKGVAPKTTQEEVAVRLESLTDDAKEQRIPLEYEHLLRE